MLSHQVVDLQRRSFGALDGQPLVRSGLAFLDLVVADLVAAVVRRGLPLQQAAFLGHVAHLVVKAFHNILLFLSKPVIFFLFQHYPE